MGEITTRQSRGSIFVAMSSALVFTTPLAVLSVLGTGSLTSAAIGGSLFQEFKVLEGPANVFSGLGSARGGGVRMPGRGQSKAGLVAPAQVPAFRFSSKPF